MKRSIIGEGAEIYGEVINSVLGAGVSIGKGTVVRDSIIMQNTKIGENCVLAGQVGVVGHIKVGNRVTVAAQSGVTRNIDDDAVVLGSPAMPADKQRKVYVMQRKLEEMYKDIAELKKKLQ